MAGLGSESKLGIRRETTPGTGEVPTEALPFTGESFSAPRELLESQTIGGGSMTDNVVAADTESTGSITQEYDGESSGNLIWFATGANGYTANGAFTDGQITAQPTGTPGGSGTSLAAGNYYYTVAPIWEHDHIPEKVILPDSPASAQVTVTSGQEVTVGWTDPTTLTLTDFTYSGTAIYRSEVDGAASTATFVAFVSGTGNSFVDDGVTTSSGSNENADTNVSPVTNTALYEHTLVGASAATGQDRLYYLSVQISKNVGDDERYFGNKLGELDLSVGGRGETAQIVANFSGDTNETVTGEFAAVAAAIKQQTLGKKTRVVIAGAPDCDIQSWNFNLNNQLERQETLCGVTIAEGKRVIGGNFTQVFQDRTNFNRSVSGEEVAVDIYAMGEPLVTSGSTLSLSTHGVAAIPFPIYTKIAMERVIIGDFSNPVEGPGQIIASATWKALKGRTSSTDATIKLINTVSVYDGG